MADEDLKYPLNIIEELKGGLQNALKTSNVGNEKNHEDLVNKFVAETKKNYKSFNDPNRQDPQLLPPQKNLEMLYQNIGEDFKDLVNKLSLDQKQKDEATQIVAKYTNLALESPGFTPLSLSSAGKIIAEDVHKDYQEVVASLPTTNKNQMDAQAKYKTDVAWVISDPKRGNILDEIAKLNAKLQKDLNLNDRQINELNIGVGHYINSNQGAFKADLEKLKGNTQEEISREDITKYLNEKIAESNEKIVPTRAQAAQKVVIGAGKKLQNIPKTVKKVATKPTKLEQVYDAAVRGIEADVKQKANAKFTEIKSTVSHKMPPEAKEFATKIGHDALEKARAAAERVKGAKNRITTFAQGKLQRNKKGPAI